MSWNLFVLVLSILVPCVSYGFGAADGRGDKSVWQAVFKTKTIIVPLLTAIVLAAGHWLQGEEAATKRQSDAEAYLEVTRHLEAAVHVAEEEGRETRQRLEEEAATARRDAATARQERQRIEAAAVEAVALMRERDPSLTIEEALALVAEEFRKLHERAADLEDQLGGLRLYSDVAELNIFGKPGVYGDGLTYSSPLAQAMEGAWLERDGAYQPRCDRESLTKLSTVAQDSPTFPFAHYALALCAGRASDVTWRQHAGRAMEILRHTTQIAGSHRHHAAALRDVAQMTDTLARERRASIGAVLAARAGRAQAALVMSYLNRVGFPAPNRYRPFAALTTRR